MDAFSVPETGTTTTTKRGRGGGREARRGGTQESESLWALPPAADWGEQQRSSQQLSWWRGTSASGSSADRSPSRREASGQARHGSTTPAGANRVPRQGHDDQQQQQQPRLQADGEKRPHRPPPPAAAGGAMEHVDERGHGQPAPGLSASSASRQRQNDKRAFDEGEYQPNDSAGRTQQPSLTAPSTIRGESARKESISSRAEGRNRRANNEDKRVRGGGGGQTRGMEGVEERTVDVGLPPAADWSRKRNPDEMAWWRGTSPASSTLLQHDGGGGGGGGRGKSGARATIEDREDRGRGRDRDRDRDQSEQNQSSRDHSFATPAATRVDGMGPAGPASFSGSLLPPAADWTEQRSVDEVAWWRGNKRPVSATSVPPRAAIASREVLSMHQGAPASRVSASASPHSRDVHSRRNPMRDFTYDASPNSQTERPSLSARTPNGQLAATSNEVSSRHGRAPQPSDKPRSTTPHPPAPQRQGGDDSRNDRGERPRTRRRTSAPDAHGSRRIEPEPEAEGGEGDDGRRDVGHCHRGGPEEVAHSANLSEVLQGRASGHDQGKGDRERYFMELQRDQSHRAASPRARSRPSVSRLMSYSYDINDWVPERRRPRAEEKEPEGDRWNETLSKRGGLAEKSPTNCTKVRDVGAHPLLEDAGTVAGIWWLLHPSHGVRVSGTSADQLTLRPRKNSKMDGHGCGAAYGPCSADETFERRFYRKHGHSLRERSYSRQGAGQLPCSFCRHARQRRLPYCQTCHLTSGSLPLATSRARAASANTPLGGRPYRPLKQNESIDNGGDGGEESKALRRKSRRMGVNPLERNRSGLYIRQHLKEMRGNLSQIKRQAHELALLYHQRHPDSVLSSAFSQLAADSDDEDEDKSEEDEADETEEEAQDETEQERALREKVERDAREKERELNRKRWAEEKAKEMEEKRRRQDELDRRRREERLERERAEDIRRERQERAEEEERQEKAEKAEQRRRERRDEERLRARQEEEKAAEEKEKKEKEKRERRKKEEQKEQKREERQRKEHEDLLQERRQRAQKEQEEAKHKHAAEEEEEHQQYQQQHVAVTDTTGEPKKRTRKTKKAEKTKTTKDVDKDDNEEHSSSEAKRKRKKSSKKDKKSSKKGKKTRAKKDNRTEESDTEGASEQEVDETDDEDASSTASAAEEESEGEGNEQDDKTAAVLPPSSQPSPEMGFRIADIELSGGSQPVPVALAPNSPAEAVRGKNLRSRLKERIQNRADTLVFVGKDTFFAKNIDKVPFPELPSDFQVNDRQRREEKELQMLKAVFTDFALPTSYNASWYSARVALVVTVQTAIRGRLARRRYAKHKERKKIAYEMFTTEKNYTEALVHLYECRRRLEEESKIKVKSDKIKVIWQDQLTDMIELARILCARLESKVAPGSWHVSRELSDVFLDLGPRFSVYVPYIIHYNEALEALQELIKSSKRFQQFSDESSRAFRSLDFAAILIMPIQRIPRYILLLKALIKVTPRSHPDYDQLNKALDLMSTIATDINNQVKKYENHLTVCKIDSLLVPRIKEFVQPDREFVGSGMVIMYDDKKKLRRNKQKVRTVFLFSDVFLLAKHIPASGVYHLKFMIYLNPSVHVEHNPYVKDVGNEHVDCVFRLHSERADQSITLMTRTMDEKISWLIALEQTLFLIKDKLTNE